jgi:hypothetical protein
MKTLLGVARYEYRMSIKRVGVLIIFLLFTNFYSFIMLSGETALVEGNTSAEMWGSAAQLAFSMNIFFPVMAGIMASDRAVRDRKLGVRELLRVTRLQNSGYILGKFLGVSLSIITLQLSLIVLFGLEGMIFQGTGIVFVGMLVLASLLINLPGLLFVTAFSLACPLVIPLRVYQILFTGYWYWGNFLNPEFIPTIAGTLLNASGKYALAAFFDTSYGVIVSTPLEAYLNIAVLSACGTVALVAMNFVLVYQER